jgi:hypothetical protein
MVTVFDLLCQCVVHAQPSALIYETYQTVSGYDVNGNFSSPITSFVTIASVSTTACQYACTITSNCVFVVLKTSLTCYVYSTAARTSVYAQTGSTIYIRKTSG